MRRVEATRYISPMGMGYSGAQLLQADDGDEYVVKFRSNGQGLRVLPNEWVAGACALALGLPMPMIAIVNVSQELLDRTEELRAFRTTPGPQFGCKLIPHGHAEPWRAVLANAENLGDLAGILLFDTWIHNKDRSWRTSNLHVTQDPDGRYRVIIFDHGWVFGGKPNWSIESLHTQRDLVKPPFMDGAVYNAFRPHIKGTDPFDSWLRKIEHFSPKTLWRSIETVPDEWGLDLKERYALADYLLHRRRHIRPVIMGLKRRFPHWN